MLFTVSSTSASDRCAVNVIRPSGELTTWRVCISCARRAAAPFSGTTWPLESTRYSPVGCDQPVDGEPAGRRLWQVHLAGEAVFDLGGECGELLLVRAADAVDDVVAHGAHQHDRREAERDREQHGGDEGDAPADGERVASDLGAERGSPRRGRCGSAGCRTAGRSCGAGTRCTPRPRWGRRRSRCPTRGRGSRASTRRCRRGASGTRAARTRVRVSLIDLAVRSARRVPGSRRSGTDFEDRGSRAVRRGGTARAAGRASTTNENGFERKSSAPVSSASASSHSPSLAVSIRIGVHTPSSRSVPHTLYPFIPGKRMSSTIGVVRALAGPPQPVGAVVDDVDVVALGPQALAGRPRPGRPRLRRRVLARLGLCPPGAGRGGEPENACTIPQPPDWALSSLRGFTAGQQWRGATDSARPVQA